VEQGETAVPGTFNKDAATLLTISDMTVLETIVKVDETDVARITRSDSAIVQIDAFPDTTFIGRVVEISHSSVRGAAAGGSTEQAVDYEVRIQLLNPPADTRPDFSATAKIKATWVPYPGGGPTLIAVAGGHVDAAHTNPGNVKPMIAAGKIRVLAVSSDKRLDDFPDVPTYKERGFDVVRYQWRGIMTRAGAPKPVVNRLAAAIQKVQQTAEWKDYLVKVSQLDGFQGPDQFRAQLLLDKQEVEAVKKKLGL